MYNENVVVEQLIKQSCSVVIKESRLVIQTLNGTWFEVPRIKDVFGNRWVGLVAIRSTDEARRSGRLAQALEDITNLMEVYK